MTSHPRPARASALHRVALVCLLLPAAISPTGQLRGQAVTGGISVGLEVQGYPAGGILAVRTAIALSTDDALMFYGGYNATDRGDFGEHEDEEGSGPGFGVGFRHVFGTGDHGWHIGARGDLWFLDLDWTDDGGSRVGETEVTVLQPTARGGYTWLLSGDRLALDATLALGAEINIRTRGEEVGEGAVVLVGIGISYRF